MTSKQEQQAQLEARLHDGFTKIGAALQQGLTVENWFDHWVRILREYEGISDELAAAVPEQVELAGMPRTEAA